MAADTIAFRAVAETFPGDDIFAGVAFIAIFNIVGFVLSLFAGLLTNV